MTVTRAHIILLFSVMVMAVGAYLTKKANDRADGSNEKKWGKILIWLGVVILIVTIALAYKIVQR